MSDPQNANTDDSPVISSAAADTNPRAIIRCVNFRGVTFARASIVPRVNKLVKEGNKADLKKLGNILSTQYTNGDADTRAIITIVILNSIPEEDTVKLEEYMSDNLKKAYTFAQKWRGKTAKPEKEKKKKKTIVQRLEGMQK